MKRQLSIALILLCALLLPRTSTSISCPPVLQGNANRDCDKRTNVGEWYDRKDLIRVRDSPPPPLIKVLGASIPHVNIYARIAPSPLHSPPPPLITDLQASTPYADSDWIPPSAS